MKIVWRFNLAEGVDEAEAIAWFTQSLFPSAQKYGGRLALYRVEQCAHAWSIESLWPDADSRARWQGSDAFARIPNWPGSDSPWGAAADLEVAVYHEVPIA